MTKARRLIERHPQYKAFVDFLKREASVVLRPSTIANNLEQLESMRNKHGLDLKRPNAGAVFNSMEKAGISAATMNQRRHSFKMWLRFKKLEIDESLFRHKRGERVRKIHPADLLSTDDIEDIVTHTNSPALRALFWCAYDTAARPGALCALNISDVVQDRHGYVFVFRNTKTEQSRRSVRLLIPRAIGYLEQWYAVHPRRADKDAPLFISKRGNRYVPAGLTSTLKMRHQEQVGKNLNMYLFRKSRATQLLKEKRLNEIEVKTRLGHEKHSQMLEQYYAILEEKDQDEAELRYLGVADAEEQGPPQPMICKRCGAPNIAGATNCHRCKIPLTEGEMIRQAQQSLLSSPEALEKIADALADVLLRRRGQGKD